MVPSLRLLARLLPVLLVLDLLLLVRAGMAWGVGPTLAWVVVSGAAGLAVARHEIRRVFAQGRAVVLGGGPPLEAGFADAALLCLGGLLLAFPGPLTDLLGLALLVPFLRRRLAAAFRARWRRAVETGRLEVTQVRMRTPSSATSAQGPSSERSFRPRHASRLDITDAEWVEEP